MIEDKLNALKITFEKTTLKRLLEENSFELLSGQREYVWDRQQWEELWGDILGTIKDIDTKADASYTFHFFGPMFFIPTPKPRKIFILDGQQRLATVSIILALIRDILEIRRTLGNITPEDIDIYGKIDEILFISKKEKVVRLILGEKTKNFFNKLVQLEKTPSIDFKISFLKRESKKNKSTNQLFKCYKFFLNQFYSYFQQREEYRNLGKKVSDERLKCLLRSEDFTTFIHRIYEVVMNYFYVLKITVPLYDLGFEIFETLNQRGTKLEPAELFKNLVFSRLENQLGREKTSEIWNNIIDPVGIGNFGTFLRHYWISRFEHVSNKKLFRSIRRITDNMSNDEFIQLLSEMKEESVIYSALLDPSHNMWEGKDEISFLIEEINFLRFRQVFPLLLVACKKFIDSNPREFKKLLELFLNFSVRAYTILDRNPNEFERKYSEWARLLRDDKIDVKEIREFIKEELPSNKEIKEKITGMKVKDLKKARYILVKVNDSLEETPLHRIWSNQPTLEHVIPKHPDKWWEEYLKSKKMRHKDFVNRLGNLTILSEDENKELGNIPYPEKRRKYLEMKLPLNKITFEELEEFDAESIRKREEIIADLIIKNKIWGFKE